MPVQQSIIEEISDEPMDLSVSSKIGREWSDTQSLEQDNLNKLPQAVSDQSSKSLLPTVANQSSTLKNLGHLSGLDLLATVARNIESLPTTMDTPSSQSPNTSSEAIDLASKTTTISLLGGDSQKRKRASKRSHSSHKHLEADKSISLSAVTLQSCEKEKSDRSKLKEHGMSISSSSPPVKKRRSERKSSFVGLSNWKFKRTT